MWRLSRTSTLQPFKIIAKMPGRTPELYHSSLAHYMYGYGLFQPESMEKLSPGMCGYIDESGRWQPLIDLTSKRAVEAAGLTPLGDLQRLESETQIWEPRIASTVKKNDIDVSADVSSLVAAGLPIDASIAVKYSTSSNFGTILMCDSEVTVQSYDHRDVFRQWLKANAEKLMQKWPELKASGIYVATSTYEGSSIHINCWQNKNEEVSLGFKAGVTGIGGVGPNVGWVRGKSTSGWTHYETLSSRRVMFFGGVKIKFRHLHLGGDTKKKFVPQSEWRGESNKFSVRNLAEDGAIYEAEIENLGDDLEALKQEKEDEDEEE